MNSRLKLMVLVLVFMGIGSYGIKLFVTSPLEVSYASQIEQFQKTGVPDFSIPRFDQALVKAGKIDPASVNYIKLLDYQNTVIILNFWASWCEPCHVEYPSFVELSKRYADDQRLKIIAVSMDDNFEAMNTFLTAGPQPSAKNFIAGIDVSGKLAETYGTKKIPETYIIGKDKKLVRKVLDQQNWISPEFIEFLETLMKVNK